MERYQTRRYVAVSWPEAMRLARLDGTPPDDIREAMDVRLIHRTEWWAWWSDERLTTAIGLPEALQPRGLSIDAEELIMDAFTCDSLTPANALKLLANVRRICDRERSRFRGQGDGLLYASFEKLIVEYQDGTSGVVYRLWTGYAEGEFYQIRIES